MPALPTCPQLFHLPMREAAERLGSSMSLLKKKCRLLGVARWPFRKIRSLSTLADTLEGAGGGDGPLPVVQDDKVGAGCSHHCRYGLYRHHSGLPLLYSISL